MISFLLLLGQCVCVIGLIYAALLATLKIDWLDDLPAASLESGDAGESGSETVDEAKPAARRLRVM